MSDNGLSRGHRNKKKTNSLRFLGKHQEAFRKPKKDLIEIKESDVLPLSDKADDINLKVRASLISKKFELSQNEKLKELLGIGKSSREIKDFWALRNVNFEVYDGEAIGIIGLNGSGKSTLLNIIDKSLSTTTGELEINGEVSYIAIGAGLKVGLTGRDNIRLKGTMMGMTKNEIEEKMDDIIEFSELGPFIDRQVKDYSSGMRSKLAFSIAVNQDPDILIIDEALSVGDSTFAAKSAKKMFEFRERGKTIFVVSHNAGQIQKWTDKVIWLHYGEVKEYGATKDVLPKYQTFITWFNKLSKEQQEQYKLDRRQEQLDFSVDALKQEVIDNSEDEVAKSSLAVIDKTIAKSKNKMKLTIVSKIVLAICVIFMMYTVVVSAKTAKSDKSRPVKVSTSVSSASSQHASKKSSPSKSTTKEKKSSSQKVSTFDYQVKEGDTLSSIAATYGISVDDILKLNPGLDPAQIRIGMIIKLPKSVEGKANSVTNTESTTTAPDSESGYTGQEDSGDSEEMASPPEGNSFPIAPPVSPVAPPPISSEQTPPSEVPTPSPELPSSEIPNSSPEENGDTVLENSE